MWLLSFLFMIAAVVVGGTVTEVVDDSQFDCTSLSTTPLAGNDAAIDIVRMACQNHPVCNEQFATEYIGDLDPFKTLLQQVSPFSPPLTLESSVQMFICGRTLEEVRNLLWAERLVQAINEFFPCAPGERFTLLKGGTEGKCIPTISNTLNSCDNEHHLKWIAIAILGLLLLASIATNIYNLFPKPKKE